jgi:hypothetical protein
MRLVQWDSIHNRWSHNKNSLYCTLLDERPITLCLSSLHYRLVLLGQGILEDKRKTNKEE